MPLVPLAPIVVRRGGPPTASVPDPTMGEPSPLSITDEDGIVTVTIRGSLDCDVGQALGAATADAVRRDARRLDIDLRQVASFTQEGATSLRACRPRAAGLREGLHYRTGRGPGREALLAAYLPAAVQPG